MTIINFLSILFCSTCKLRRDVCFTQIYSATYNLLKFLSRILSSLLVNPYSVRNSKEFVDYVQNFTLSENEILVSFDVVSLLSSVQVDKALGLVLDLFSSDESLALRISLDIPHITIGLEHCFSSTVFSYLNSFFKRIYGTPMGSCISPIITSIYMEHIEHTAITTFHILPSLRLRYVDDTFCILNKDHINDFHTSQFNILAYSVHHRNFSLPFLDVLVKRKSRNGDITTHSIFYLPQFTEIPLTPTDIFTTSHHLKHQKLTVAKTLLSRVKTHITDNTQKYSDLQNIRRALRINGFPTRTTFLTSKQTRPKNKQYNHFTFIPLHKRHFEKCQKSSKRGRGESCFEIRSNHLPSFTFTEGPTHPLRKYVA